MPKKKRARSDHDDDYVFSDEGRRCGQGEKLTAGSSGIGSHCEEESQRRNSSLKESLKHDKKKRREENDGGLGVDPREKGDKTTTEGDGEGNEADDTQKNNEKSPKRDHRPPALKILSRENKESGHMPVVETG